MNTLKVLIVEDDESLTKGIQRFLNESVETVIATDGLEGQMLGEEKNI
jgi:two-component system response regulator CiaR